MDKRDLLPAFTAICDNYLDCGYCPLYRLENDADWRNCRVIFQTSSLDKQIQIINEMAEGAWERDE